MMSKTKKLVIIGDGEFAEIAYEYFTYDSEYDVAGFVVEKDYLTKNSLFGLPVTVFEEIDKIYPASEFEAFVAITFTKLNRIRTRLYEAVKQKGYRCATYISSHAFVWHNASIGENSFIFENNVLQYHVKVGNNVVLWSGNHVGHRTVIQDNNFISSHVVISGYCNIGESCFLGVNSTLNDNITIGKDCLIASGGLVVKNLEAGGMYKGSPVVLAGSTYNYFKLEA